MGAVERVFIGGSNELGAFESGTAAALIGAVPAVAIGGILAMAAAAFWAWRSPSCAGSTASRTRRAWDPTPSTHATRYSVPAVEAAVDVVGVHRSAASSKNVRRMRAPSGLAER